MRIGQGFDVHRLTEGRPLILGGVVIPYELGLLGHSDADVLLHAIMDALLGAIAARDIGYHFPDSCADFRGADSMELLAKVVALVREQGYRVVNLDTTILAQKPKVAAYIEAMRINIAKVIKVSPAVVSIKATTTEGLGFTGRGEGIAAMAVALLEKAND